MFPTCDGILLKVVKNENFVSDDMAIELGAPVRVSPLIKFSRWTALIAGIYWGSKRFAANKAAEDEVRAYNAKMQPIWDAEKKAAAEAANREQLIYLANATGTPIPEGF